jgi:hypothetical protein
MNDVCTDSISPVDILLYYMYMCVLKCVCTSSISDSTQKVSTIDLIEGKIIASLPSLVKVSNGRRHSSGGSGKFNGLLLGRKNYLFPSMSNLSDSKVPSSLFTDNKATSAVDFDNISMTISDGLENMIASSRMMKKKKRSLMRRIGDAARRKILHK